MLEVSGGSAFHKIDTFIVTLSMLLNSRITSYTGELNISVINLSYYLFRLNLEDSADTMIPPESEHIQCSIISTLIYVYMNLHSNDLFISLKF